MTVNKKFGLIEIFFLIIPIVGAFINAEYSNLKNFPWGNNNVNMVSMLALSIAIVGNVYIYWNNKKYQPTSKAWKLISLFLILMLVVILLLGNSISNFGF